MQKKGSETSLGLIGPLNQTTIQDNFMKKTLSQILGLFVIVALAP
jgi:hypothetical protein